MTRINPAELAWIEAFPGVRYKTVNQHGRRVRLIEFLEGFQEPDWCRRGHIGYVLAGRLEVAFSNRVETFTAGDILLIAAGEEDQHRARVLEGPVRIFVVEDE